MSYEGLVSETDASNPHLGGNIREGDPFTFAPSVWRYVIERFSIKSVLDLGSGIGYSSHFFHRAGLQVIAVDGLPSNVERAVYPTLQLDLTKTPAYCRVDLVHCQEVVEHIEEKYVENVLRSLACGKFILMTHASVGQGGHHHVNEQSDEYWVQHLRRHDCELLVEDTKRVRALAAADQALYLSRTGLVFANRSVLDSPA